MKLAGGRWATFARRPGPEIQAVLLFGTEPGMVHRRALDLANIWLEGNDDPFALTHLASEDLSGQPERLFEAACQPSLLGGNRVVRLSGMADAQSKIILSVLGDPSLCARIVIEAGNLTPRSKLRQAFESGTTLAAAGCYPLEGRALRDHIAGRLSGLAVSFEQEAIDFIAERLTDNLGQIDQELDKLALLAGEGGRLDRALVALGLGDAAESTMDVLTLAIGTGDLTGCEQALGRLFAANQSSVGLLRVVLRHIARLHQARCKMETGEPAEKAAASLSPPVMPRQRAEFSRQINLLDRSALEMMMDIVTRAERACKSSGIPDTAVAGQSLMAASLVAARQASRRRGSRANG